MRLVCLVAGLAMCALGIAWFLMKTPDGTRPSVGDGARLHSDAEPWSRDSGVGLVGKSGASPDAGPTVVAPREAPPRAVVRILVTGRVVWAGSGEPATGGTVQPLPGTTTVAFTPIPVGPDGLFKGELTAGVGHPFMVFYRVGDDVSSEGVLIRPVAATTERVVLHAEPTCRVDLTVRDRHGRVVAGAEVEGRGAIWPLRARTDTSGMAVFKVPVGLNCFWVRAPDGARGQTDGSLRLKAGARVAHTVSVGAPWVAVPLRVRAGDAGAPPSGEIARVTIVRHGRVERCVVRVDGEPGNVEVPTDDVPMSGFVDVEGRPRTTFRWRWEPAARSLGISIELPLLGSVVVTALDDSGRALPNLTLVLLKRVQGRDGQPRLVAIARERTGANGVTQFSDVPFGSYDLSVQGEQRSRQSLRVHMPRDSIRLSWEGLRVISGTIHDPHGLLKHGHPHVVVAMDDRQWAASLRGVRSEWTVTAPAGSGRSHVFVREGEGASPGVGRKILPNKNDDIVLDLSLAATLTITLSSDDGRPRARRRVLVRVRRIAGVDEGVSSDMSLEATAVVDDKPVRFHLIPPGAYDVIVLDPDDRASALHRGRLEIPAGHHTALIELH